MVNHFKIFLAFCMAFEISDTQLTPQMICAFIEFLANSYSCPATIRNIVSSVSSVRDWLGLPTDVFHHKLVQQMHRAIAVTLRYTPKFRNFLNFQQLYRIAQSSVVLGVNCVLFRAFALLLFFSMARVSTLLPAKADGFDLSRNATVGDLLVNGKGFLLKLKWAKNLQTSRDAYCIPILPNVNEAICPVKALYGYLLQRRFDSKNSPLFTLVDRNDKNVCLSISAANNFLRTVIEHAGLIESRITLHSFRRGACTAAYESGASITDIGSYGGWHSNALLRYLSESKARNRVAHKLTFA